VALFQAGKDQIADFYERREYSKAIREIMALADRANQYIAERQPWVLAKENKSDPQVQAICSTGINLFRLLMIYLKPVLPQMAARAETFLCIAPLNWIDLDSVLVESPHRDI